MLRYVHVEAAGCGLRLCCMWARTSWLDAKAATRDSSPASVAPATTLSKIKNRDTKDNISQMKRDRTTEHKGRRAHKRVIVS